MCCVILSCCLSGVHCRLHGALWCVFSWAEHEVQHWQCVLCTAPPLDLACSCVASHATQQVDVGAVVHVCLLCVCVYLVWWTCCVYMHGLVLHWSVWISSNYIYTLPSLGTIYTYMYMIVCWLFLSCSYHVHWFRSHSHSHLDWTPSFPPLFAPRDTTSRCTTIASHLTHTVLFRVNTVAILSLLSVPHDIIIISLYTQLLIGNNYNIMPSLWRPEREPGGG